MSTSPLIQIQPKTSPARLPRNGKRFFIWTIGCQMNEADSAKVAAMLQEVGYEPARTENDADIVVLNSCVVRQAAEDKVTGKLNSLVQQFGQAGEDRLLLMAALLVADELWDARARLRSAGFDDGGEGANEPSGLRETEPAG